MSGQRAQGMGTECTLTAESWGAQAMSRHKEGYRLTYCEANRAQASGPLPWMDLFQDPCRGLRNVSTWSDVLINYASKKKEKNILSTVCQAFCLCPLSLCPCPFFSHVSVLSARGVSRLHLRGSWTEGTFSWVVGCIYEVHSHFSQSMAASYPSVGGAMPSHQLGCCGAMGQDQRSHCDNDMSCVTHTGTAE